MNNTHTIIIAGPLLVLSAICQPQKSVAQDVQHRVLVELYSSQN